MDAGDRYHHGIESSRRARFYRACSRPAPGHPRHCSCFRTRLRLKFPSSLPGGLMAALPVTPSPVPGTAPLSEGARIVDTFIAPSKTFTDLRRSASWWAPWLLLSIVGMAFVFVVGRQIGFDQLAHNQINASARSERPLRAGSAEPAGATNQDHRRHHPLCRIFHSRAQLVLLSRHRHRPVGDFQSRRLRPTCLSGGLMPLWCMAVCPA